MGNGRLGIAVWSAEGFTAQLNRVDTLPHRDSPGQLVIPGLTALASARDFTGRLDLYNGTLIEHGGGMSLTAYVQVSTDTLRRRRNRRGSKRRPRQQNFAFGRRARLKPRPLAKRACSPKPGPTNTDPERLEKRSDLSPLSPQLAAMCLPLSAAPAP